MTTREPPDRRAIGEIAQADWTLGVRTYACHEAPQGHPSVPAGLVDGLEANDLNHFRLFCTDTFHLPCNQVLQTTDEELGARSGSGRAIRERARDPGAGGGGRRADDLDAAAKFEGGRVIPGGHCLDGGVWALVCTRAGAQGGKIQGARETHDLPSEFAPSQKKIYIYL